MCTYNAAVFFVFTKTLDHKNFIVQFFCLQENLMSQLFAKYWSFSFSIIPSKEIPGLISVRMDWLDLLAVQGTLKSLL